MQVIVNKIIKTLKNDYKCPKMAKNSINRVKLCPIGVKIFLFIYPKLKFVGRFQFDNITSKITTIKC